MSKIIKQLNNDLSQHFVADDWWQTQMEISKWEYEQLIKRLKQHLHANQ